MISLRTAAVLAGVLLVSAGCSTASFPPWASGRPATSGTAVAPPGMPELGATNFEPAAPNRAEPSGTGLGEKAVALRADLATLNQIVGQRNARLQRTRGAALENARAYHAIEAAAGERLQAGATPDNPALQHQWAQARDALNRLENDVAAMESLSRRAASDAELAEYLLRATRPASSDEGAVEDYRQFDALEEEIGRTLALLDRLRSEVDEDVTRQRGYIRDERGNLQRLAEAIEKGGLGPPAGADRPLVIIRFDDPELRYEQPLYEALSEALDRRPDANFEVVAVSPEGGDSSRSRGHADRVVTSMTEMGMPEERIRRSSAEGGGPAGEVHIYVR